jgi:uncharacterized protein (DUF1697 family)
MPDLRTALAAAGYEDVATLVQSGNILLTSAKKPKTLEQEISKLVREEFGVEAATVVRTRDELAGVIERNPIPDGPSIPKLFQVTFFSGEPDPDRVAALREQDFGNEQLVVIGREAYAWHPDGIQSSKLARELGKGLRGDGTARNWNTVTKLLELADAP